MEGKRPKFSCNVLMFAPPPHFPKFISSFSATKGDADTLGLKGDHSALSACERPDDRKKGVCAESNGNPCVRVLTSYKIHIYFSRSSFSFSSKTIFISLFPIL